MPEIATAADAAKRPLPPERDPARYEGDAGADARRSMVLIRAARTLLHLPRPKRTMDALHAASVSIATALEWPEAVFARQHVERCERVGRLYRRIRFGPAWKRDAQRSTVPPEVNAQLAQEKRLRRAAEDERDRTAARLASLRETNALEQVRMFARLYNLTISDAGPARTEAEG